MDHPLDPDQAIDRLMRFLAVPGVTGKEAAIAHDVAKALRELGVPESAIRYDDANTKIPLPTECGNLIVSLAGTRPGPRRMFSTHLDTVPLCAGAVPVRKGNRIVPAGKTALGGDNRTGCAVLVTVREESGLWGARFVDAALLGPVEMGFNIDGGSPRELTLGALGADRWAVEIFGKASHAGVRPEHGISATMVAAHALADIHKSGWFGKVTKSGREGTSNVGPVGDGVGGSAGQATNVVTDYVRIQGESRSHDAAFIGKITAAYAEAFKKAATKVKDVAGKSAKVKFTKHRDYHPFRLKDSAPVVKVAQAAAETVGWTAKLRTSNGGLDANWLTRNGVPTITFGAGQNGIHTVDEWVNLDDYLDGCRFALALAMQA
jgi:tripeptide aminopeptidase